MWTSILLAGLLPVASLSQVICPTGPPASFLLQLASDTSPLAGHFLKINKPPEDDRHAYVIPDPTNATFFYLSASDLTLQDVDGRIAEQDVAAEKYESVYFWTAPEIAAYNYSNLTCAEFATRPPTLKCTNFDGNVTVTSFCPHGPRASGLNIRGLTLGKSVPATCDEVTLQIVCRQPA